MSVALAGRVPATFEIKSAQLPLVALLLKSADLTEVAQELQQRFGDTPDFFNHDPLLIDLSPLQAAAADAEVDFPALLALLRSHRVAPLAVRGGSPAQMAAALAAGLTFATEARLHQPEVAATTAVEAPPEVVTLPSGALVIDRPLRSGQQVYARGRDVVLLAMVNAGAEVIADGHIHVYAPLRGRALAGARGNVEARIFSLCMEPELISIAGIYRTSENGLPAEVRGKPTQVRLQSGPDGEKLILEPIKA